MKLTFFQKKETIEPKMGEVKKVKRFAFFPTKLTTGITVWLETYYVTYVFDKTFKPLEYKDYQFGLGPKLVSQKACPFPAGYYKNDWKEYSKM